jgi:(E)-4-hydroxy-3-methylbut-2-enyl-diphosphate synthase
MVEKTLLLQNFRYCESLTRYSRRKTREVYIGDLPVGGINPIRLQSMTIVDTMDTQCSIEQSIRMIEAGCEYVRITAPSLNSAKNLKNIKAGLRARGYNTPLIADIHFTPQAAELAATLVEKVRVNPGNYADRKKFQQIEYSDADYAAELRRIRERFSPLVKICKDHGTAMRIGTNHGSLSDRIMSRYGDTPLGMVESALEFVRICEDLGYYDLVLSMKASNPQVMVQAYRLLVNRLEAESLQPYPLHLGVTEAGEGEDGRIKSAAGIGLLLEDGLGDTIRVSLTEDPEFEIPVARILADRYKNRSAHKPIPGLEVSPKNPFEYFRRESHEVFNLGGTNVPRVIIDISEKKELSMKDLASIGHFYLPEPDKWIMNDTGSDFIYSGNTIINFMLPNGLKEIVDYNGWLMRDDKSESFPLFELEQISDAVFSPLTNFIRIESKNAGDDFFTFIKSQLNFLIILETSNLHGLADQRRFFFELIQRGITNPVIIKRDYNHLSSEEFICHSSTDAGGLFIDGFGDGIWLSLNGNDHGWSDKIKLINRTSFGILQAARTRTTKTEYISCPSCGRTLFDLQKTTAMIRKRTDHLKGVKIGIMGCIVNGPGEMADADYGYVGSGRNKITLYKGKEVIKRSVTAEHAVDELIEIIKNDGNWIEPASVN